MYWFDVYCWLMDWVDQVTLCADKSTRFELINSINAWELNSMYESGTDRLHRALFEAPNSKKQFLRELENKNILRGTEILAQLPKSPTPVEDPKMVVESDNIAIEGNGRKLTIRRTERLNKLLEKYRTQDVLDLLVRYRAITLKEGTSSYQWAYQGRSLSEAEAFASPMNVARFPTEAIYCSAFSEDKKFNSLGSFFKLGDSVLAKYQWHINPPFTEMILEAAARLATTKLRKFVFVMPLWSDSKAYEILKESNCFSKVLKKRTYSYETDSRLIPATFNTIVFDCDL